jgi:peptidoglycan/LPS O-acetylase OafA/YrhL
MIISISNAVVETVLVVWTAVIMCLATIRNRTAGFLPRIITDELKGVAVLMVVLSHIGYFLVSDHQFLQPLSNYAGVGVDLFLILSGFGLSMSALERPLSMRQFYLKKFWRLYVPVGVLLTLLLVLDFAVLHKTYPLSLTIKNFFGLFPSADLYGDINSPLWFITLLLFFYLLFPLLFSRRFPLVSAIIFGGISWSVSMSNLQSILPITEGVASLYRLHLWAFPVGVAVAGVVYHVPRMSAHVTRVVQNFMKNSAYWPIVKMILFVLCSSWFVYIMTRSAVGQGWKKEEWVSIWCALATIAVFLTKPFESRALSIIGAYSFEIYLIHWPLLYRYNVFYSYVPAGLATVIYIVFFLVLGAGYHKLIGRFFGKSTKTVLAT